MQEIGSLVKDTGCVGAQKLALSTVVGACSTRSLLFSSQPCAQSLGSNTTEYTHSEGTDMMPVYATRGLMHREYCRLISDARTIRSLAHSMDTFKAIACEAIRWLQCIDQCSPLVYVTKQSKGRGTRCFLPHDPFPIASSYHFMPFHIHI